MSKRRHHTIVADAIDFLQQVGRKHHKSSTIESRECIICADSHPISSFPREPHSPINHMSNICTTCFSTHLATAVQEKKTTEIRCPSYPCTINLTEADVRGLGTKATYDLFLEKSMKEFLSQDPDYHECPSSTCTFGYILTQNDLESDAIFNCRVCEVKYCTRCNVVFHSGETCKQYTERVASEKRSNKRKEDEASAKYIERATKACPKCSTQIEKNGGCNHMSCRICRHQFCWICRADWLARRRCGH